MAGVFVYERHPMALEEHCIYRYPPLRTNHSSWESGFTLAYSLPKAQFRSIGEYHRVEGDGVVACRGV